MNNTRHIGTYIWYITCQQTVKVSKLQLQNISATFSSKISLCTNVFSERERETWTHVHLRNMLSPVRLSVCRLSVKFVHPTYLAVGNFRQFLRHLVPLPSVDIHGKLYGDRTRGTPTSRRAGKNIVFTSAKCHLADEMQNIKTAYRLHVTIAVLAFSKSHSTLHANVVAFLYFWLHVFCVSRIFHPCILDCAQFVPHFHVEHFQSPLWSSKSDRQLKVRTFKNPRRRTAAI